MSGSDEAIISDDPAGQHNPQGSQGPLDWIAQQEESVTNNGLPARAIGFRGKSFWQRISRKMKVAVQFQFEAVLGKTRRTEF
jgi:hypothetical protein